MNKFIIGLVLGIAIAAGFAFYLNNMPNQFTKRVTENSSGGIVDASGPMILAPSTKLKPVSASQAATNQVASNPTTTAASAAKSASSSPSYDFYYVLQGKKANDASGAAAESQNQPVAVEPKFYAAAGVFVSKNLAENMKAELALLGFSADIKTQQVSGRVLNRVLIGPFVSEEQANMVVNKLSAHKINAVLFKE